MCVPETLTAKYTKNGSANPCAPRAAPEFVTFDLNVKQARNSNSFIFLFFQNTSLFSESYFALKILTQMFSSMLNSIFVFSEQKNYIQCKEFRKSHLHYARYLDNQLQIRKSEITMRISIIKLVGCVSFRSLSQRERKCAKMAHLDSRGTLPTFGSRG